MKYIYDPYRNDIYSSDSHISHRESDSSFPYHCLYPMNELNIHIYCYILKFLFFLSCYKYYIFTNVKKHQGPFL